MAQGFNNPRRASPARKKQELPRLDLTGQNTGASRRSPTAPSQPSLTAAPGAPPRIDPRIAQSRQAFSTGLDRGMEFADEALGDVAGVGGRLNAGIIRGAANLTGLFSPEAGSAFMAAADRQQAAADEVARRGFFTEATPGTVGQAAQPAQQAAQPGRGQAAQRAQQAAQTGGGQAQAQPAQTPQTAAERDLSFALSQRMPNLSDIPLDMGEPVQPQQQAQPQQPELTGAETRRNVIERRAGKISGPLSGIPQDQLGTVMAQLINARGNIAAAEARAVPEAPDPVTQAQAQVLQLATGAFQQVANDPNATAEEKQAAYNSYREAIEGLAGMNRTPAEEILGLQRLSRQ